MTLPIHESHFLLIRPRAVTYAPSHASAYDMGTS